MFLTVFYLPRLFCLSTRPVSDRVAAQVVTRTSRVNHKVRAGSSHATPFYHRTCFYHNGSNGESESPETDVLVAIFVISLGSVMRCLLARIQCRVVI